MPPVNIHYVKFLRGSIDAYNSLKAANKLDDDTLYFVYTNSTATKGVLYLGSKLISGSTEGGTPSEISLADLSNIKINNNTLANQQILVYNSTNQKWENTNLETIISTAVSEMEGATTVHDGTAGLVPAPQAGDENKFLKGDGTWTKINIPKFDNDIFEESTIGQLTLLNSVDASPGQVPFKTETGKLGWKTITSGGVNRQIVADKDSIDLTDTDTIFLIKKPDQLQTTGDLYDEYMVISGVPEKIGTLSGSNIDLSEYATITFVESKIGVLTDLLEDKEIIDPETGDTFIEPGIIGRLNNLEEKIGDLSEYSITNTLVDKVQELDNRMTWEELE